MADGNTKASKPRRRRNAPAPTTPDPIEMAMEAEAADARADSPARRVLIKHEKLIDWQIASERAGVALKVLTGLVGLAAAGALGVMVWDASQADGVILEPFTVPPALAAEGVSGEVVAGQVLDELARLRAETVLPGEDRDYGDDWGRSIKVAIPTTGVSLGDLQDALRQWLGHETHISGEVYRTPAGLTLRARIPGRPGLKVDGAADALEASAQTLARQIYRDTQPLRYATWLVTHDDPAGAIRVAQPIAIAGRSPAERATAYGVLSAARNDLGDAAGAIAMAQEGLKIEPGRSALWAGLALNEANQGHLENAIRASRKLIEVLPRDRAIAPDWRDTYSPRASLAVVLLDYQEAHSLLQRAESVPNVVLAEAVQLDVRIARNLGRLHDIAGARARLDRPRFALSWQATRNERQVLHGRISNTYAAEDWPGVLALAPAFLALPDRYADRPHSANFAIIGLARAATGDARGAAEILDVLAPDSDNAMLIKGRALLALGDIDGADRLFTLVATRAPSVASGPFYRGLLRVEQGQAAAALPFLAEAKRRAPRFADPLKYEGDALAALGRWSEAEAAYAKAEPFAPKWGGLHLKWGEALAKLGKASDAQAKWRAAAAMDLTAAERARVTALLQKRTS
ncbi:hypothetical protein [Phenylobacterium sp.]|uniref:hypothetical protein n=1 Tax=Phenylobacterium sp. TaxID=1871053 RepID=UPI003983A13C